MRKCDEDNPKLTMNSESQQPVIVPSQEEYHEEDGPIDEKAMSSGAREATSPGGTTMTEAKVQMGIECVSKPLIQLVQEMVCSTCNT